MTAHEYDQAVGDLVGYLQWMGEPAQKTRVRIGVWVLMFLLAVTTSLPGSSTRLSGKTSSKVRRCHAAPSGVGLFF